MAVITIVRGEVSQDQQRAFEEGYHHIKDRFAPDGLIKSKLLHDEDHATRYQIETTWEDRDSFEKFRAQTKTLPGVALFKQVGSQTEIAVYDITEELTPALTESA